MSAAVFPFLLVHSCPRVAICVPMALLGLLFPGHGRRGYPLGADHSARGRRSSRHRSHARLPADQIHHGQRQGGS